MASSYSFALSASTLRIARPDLPINKKRSAGGRREIARLPVHAVSSFPRIPGPACWVPPRLYHSPRFGHGHGRFTPFAFWRGAPPPQSASPPATRFFGWLDRHAWHSDARAVPGAHDYRE